MPRNFPAVLIIFTGRGRAGSPPLPTVRDGAGNPPFPAGRVPRGAGRPSLMSVMMKMLIIMVSTSHAVASCRELAVYTLPLVVLVVLVVLSELQMEPLVRYLCRGF